MKLKYLHIFLVFLLLLTGCSLCAGTSYKEFNYSKTITIDHTQVIENLTDFPVLVSIVNDADIGTHARDNGYDINFTTADGFVLPYERESFNISNGVANGVIWVKVPSLSSKQDTSIVLRYNNSTCPDGQVKTEVWDSNSLLVQHLSENPTQTAPQYSDSTDKFKGTITGYVDSNNRVEGKIGNAIKLGSNNYIYYPDNLSVSNSHQSLTMDCWVNLSPSQISSATELMSKSQGYGIVLYDNANPVSKMRGELKTLTNAWAFSQISTATIERGSWQKLTMTYNGTSGTVSYYINGNYDFSDSTTFTGLTYPSSEPFSINSRNPSIATVGTYDEVRVSKIDRSAGYIKTEYNNENNPSAFERILAETVYIPYPYAHFTKDVLTGIKNTSIHFTDISTNNPTSWNWNFGDGATSTEQNPTHTYTTAGTYTVTLTVSNEWGTNSTSYSMIIHEPNYLYPDFPNTNSLTLSSNPGIGYQIPINVTYEYSVTNPMNVNFTDLRFDDGTNKLSYWIVPDSIVSGDSCKVYVKLASNSKTIYQHWGKLTATSESNIDNTMLFGDEFTSSTINTAKWIGTGSISNGVLSTAAGQALFSVPKFGRSYELISRNRMSSTSGQVGGIGFYDGVANGLMQNEELSNVYVQLFTRLYGNPNPVNSIAKIDGNWHNSRLLYDSTSVLIYDDISVSTSGYIPDIEIPILITDAVTGSFDVDYLAVRKYTGLDPEITNNNETLSLPIPSFKANRTIGNDELEVSFTDTSKNNPISWRWNFGDGTTSTLQNPTHVFSPEGTYNVTLDVANVNGHSYTHQNIIVDNHFPEITWYNPENITVGTPLNSTQLNAVCSREGTFYYSPVSGKYLRIGNNTLTCIFDPVENYYGNQTSSVYLNVIPKTGTTAVFIGNSLTSGVPGNRSWLEANGANSPNPIGTISYEFEKVSGITSYDMGIYGQTTSQIRTRFPEDVIAYHPTYCFIENGVNDVARGVSNETILSNVIQEITFCDNNNIKPILFSIFPWTDGNAAKQAQINYLNEQFKTLNTEYPNVTFIDIRPTVGIYTDGIWTIIPSYNADGIHFTQEGYYAIGDFAYFTFLNDSSIVQKIYEWINAVLNRFLNPYLHIGGVLIWQIL